MSPRPLALAILLALPLALAQAELPPVEGSGVSSAEFGPVAIAHWVGERERAVSEFEAGSDALLWFAVRTLELTPNATARYALVNVSADPFAPEEPHLTFPAGSSTLLWANSTQVWSYGSIRGVLPPETSRGQPYDYTFEVYDETPNGTVLVASGPGTGMIVVSAPAGPPVLWLIVGATLLVVGGGALAYSVRQRAIRRRMMGAPRSQVMRERELDERIEKAKAPEQVEQIQQEIRREETVRVQRRELQILAAKRADAIKTLDLLQKRHESGGLTKLQYDHMAAKKRAELERIEAEIAQMEREG